MIAVVEGSFGFLADNPLFGYPMTEEGSFCEGGCACWEVRYRLTSAPMIVHACHCRLCQIQTGSSNVVNALFEADRVLLLSGEIVEHTLATPSGKGQRVSRCPICRTEGENRGAIPVKRYGEFGLGDRRIRGI
jgi:hypothetical protein